MVDTVECSVYAGGTRGHGDDAYDLGRTIMFSCRRVSCHRFRVVWVEQGSLRLQATGDALV
ncbi:hypothetical protein K435DRAFT_88296 [Dendrothele bispora CBS 962.96]|uniref:Uncharacterized protein n=1 Tax=Dendrothele bispora (strain CBS 962.96) TaxID=1314807 RepID=A0A4S8KPQ3_DENBC|nr:hypothetical protein K435DRAFT_88296 [Dendrothele bispora CBS 962.96]